MTHNPDEIKVTLKGLEKIQEEFPKILVLGDSVSAKDLVLKIITLVNIKFKEAHIILTNDTRDWKNLELENIYDKFYPMLKERCFRKNHFLFIDFYEYTEHSTSIIFSELKKCENLYTVYCVDADSKSVKESDIDTFDYIFFTGEKLDTILGLKLQLEHIENLKSLLKIIHNDSPKYYLVYSKKHDSLMYYNV